MKSWRVFFALFTFGLFVAIAPVVLYFTQSYPDAQLSLEAQFLATLVLPATVMLYLAGWLDGG